MVGRVVTDQPISTATEAPAAQSVGAGGGEYQAARLAYAAFEALVSAEIYGRQPILQEIAAARIVQAKEALTLALAKLEPMQ